MARWLQGGLHGVAIGALLLSPWDSRWAWVKLPLLLMALWEARRTARRLSLRCGELAIDEQGAWQWQGRRWRLKQPLRWLPCGVLVVLRGEKAETMRFWLMQDNMTPAAWRALRALWFTRQGRSE